METVAGWLVLIILAVSLIYGPRVGQRISHKLVAYFYNKYGMLRIKEIILTANLDKAGFPTLPASTFSQSNQRIYCFITYQVSKAVDYYRTDLLVKWYYQGKPIHNSRHSLPDDYPILAYSKVAKDKSFRPGHFLSYIEAPTNDPFDRGRYTIKLFIEHSIKVSVRTVEFEVA